MAACADFTLTVNLWRVIEDGAIPFPPVRLATLVFPDLKVNAAGAITGDVYIGSTKLSAVTGTCTPSARPDGNILMLAFNWNTIDIFLMGFTHLDGVKKFKGRYFVSPHVGLVPPEFDRSLLAFIPPDTGDTGTGTGTQT